MKSHVRSQKVIEKSNIHEGSSRVTREVMDHPNCYIYTLIAHIKEFSPWLLLLGIREEDSSFGGAIGQSNAPLLGIVVFTVFMYLGNFT